MLKGSLGALTLVTLLWPGAQDSAMQGTETCPKWRHSQIPAGYYWAVETPTTHLTWMGRLLQGQCKTVHSQSDTSR